MVSQQYFPHKIPNRLRIVYYSYVFRKRNLLEKNGL
jgi:hypothetical protein